MNPFKVIIVEDVALELKGTEGIFRNEIPEAEIIYHCRCRDLPSYQGGLPGCEGTDLHG